jgi:hypothetical protein
MIIPMISLCIVVVILVYLLYKSEKDYSTLAKLNEHLVKEIDRLRNEVK